LGGISSNKKKIGKSVEKKEWEQDIIMASANKLMLMKRRRNKRDGAFVSKVSGKCLEISNLPIFVVQE
jgi:hypothetical protein